MRIYRIFALITCVTFISSLSLLSQQCGEKNKFVGIGYSTWFKFHKDRTDAIRFHDKTLNPNGEFGPYSSPHWWGYPEITNGNNSDYELYFDASSTGEPMHTNQPLIDDHANKLVAAGVDFVGLDLSNGGQEGIWKGAKALCKGFTNIRNSQGDTPKVVPFILHNNLDIFFDDLYAASYINSDIFFKYDGKPLVLVADKSNVDPNWLPNTAWIQAWTEHFTIIPIWGLSGSSGMWSFKQNIDHSEDTLDYFDYNNWPEESSACAATQGEYMYNDCFPSALEPKPRNGGSYWDNQWADLSEINPSFVFIWSWNEWISSNWCMDDDKAAFVDIYGFEHGADLEPSLGYGDEYYQKLISEVEKIQRDYTKLFHER